MTFQIYIYYFLFLVVFCFSISTQIDPSIKHRTFDIPPEIIGEPEPHPDEHKNRLGDRVLIYFKATERRRIRCTASGEPRPSFLWKKDGVTLDLTPSKSSKMTIESGLGTLIFLNMSKSDAGIYQCVATNVHGTALSLKADLRFSINTPFPTLSEPEEVKAFFGNNATLKCDLPVSVPKSSAFWTNSSGEALKKLEMSDRIIMDYTGNLHFANVKKEDENNGKPYVCNTYHAIMRSFNQGEDKKLVVTGSDMRKPVDELWKSNTSVLGLKGETARFMCVFSGNPTPTIKWKRLGGQRDNRRMNESYTGHEFVITNIQPGDAGQYQCEGSNKVTVSGNIRRITFTLKVEAKPSWRVVPQDITVGINENAEFQCNAEGTPTPSVEWFINGKRIQEVSNPRRLPIANGLKFATVTKEDSQVIQCLATNIHGSLWSDVYLNVIALSPEIRPAPEDIKVAAGYSQTLTCENNGKPTPVLTWYKGEHKDIHLTGERYSFSQNSITILNVTSSDGGIYTCKATNSEGSAEAQSQVIVRDRTKIVTTPKSKTVTYNNAVTFPCKAITDPEEERNLKVQWMKTVDNKQLPVDLSDPAVTIGDNDELHIKQSSSKHSGNYTCVASNGIDSDSHTAQLRVKAPPDPPTNAKVPFCPGKEATIRWVPGNSNFMPIKRYIINYKTSFDNKWTDDHTTTQGDETEITVSLSPWVNYTFQIIAENDLGRSEPSEDASPVCNTQIDVPEKHPTGVKTIDDKTGYLIVEWDEMGLMEHNGPNFHYIVIVKQKGTQAEQTFVINDYQQTRKEIKVDNIYQEYEVVVISKNKQGEALSDPISYSGFSGQAAPTVVPENFELDNRTKNFTYNSAYFIWDRVDEENPEVMRGKFKGYEIRYWKPNEPEKVKGILIDESNLSRSKRQATKKATARITNLPPFSNLQLDVVVRNDHFASNGSNVIEIRTPEGVPDRVQNLQAIRRSAVHITLNWEKPFKANGIITRYDIGFEKVDGLDISPDIKMDRSVSVSPESTQNRFESYIDGLEPGTGYRIHVWAVTKIGKGKDLYIDVHTMAPGVPDQPVILEPQAGGNYINVSWSLNSESTNTYMCYVEYRKLGAKDFIPSGKTEILNNWQIVENLTSATTYEVVVVASDHHDINSGQTARSEVKIVSTLGKPEEIATAGLLSATWFIILMVALVVIILLAIIIVFFVKRSRGDKYHVQEKEKLRGLDPEDKKAAHFNEFNDNGETQPLAGSPDDIEKGPLESDKDSLEEYGDVDPSRFNEDGSFIGQYGAQNMTASDVAPPTSAMHTFV